MQSCIFCEIVRGTAPAGIVYSDETVMAFMDRNPVNPGHLLVIPKKHASLLADLETKTGEHLFGIAVRLADAIRHSGVRCEGINLYLADGEAAFQEIMHVHLHVIPRVRGDNFRLSFGRRYHLPPSSNEISKTADLIKKVLT